jgi:D-alanine-D-alanine ligase
MGLKNKLKIAVTYNEIFFKDSPDIKEVKYTAEIIGKVLEKDYQVEIIPCSEDIFTFIKNLKELFPNAIFNLCEAFQDKSIGEMLVTSIYELLNIPYTGAPPLTIGICLNKVLTKKLLVSHYLPTPPWFLKDEIEKIDDNMFPLIIKPVSEDGSLGIFRENVIFEKKELKEKIGRICEKTGVPIFLEQYIDGREFNVSFLGKEPICIGEIEFKIYPRILTYEGKWKENSEDDLGTVSKYPAELNEEEKEKILMIAKKTFEIFDLRDYARIDMRMDEKGNIYIIDINPNPDLSIDAGFARALKAKGIDYSDGIKRIIQFALERGNALS